MTDPKPEHGDSQDADFLETHEAEFVMSLSTFHWHVVDRKGMSLGSGPTMIDALNDAILKTKTAR